jgi:hypothetical protein
MVIGMNIEPERLAFDRLQFGREPDRKLGRTVAADQQMCTAFHLEAEGTPQRAGVKRSAPRERAQATGRTSVTASMCSSGDHPINGKSVADTSGGIGKGKTQTG